MTKRSDFNAGDHVNHQTMGHGVVSSVGPEYTMIKFEKWNLPGEYDDRWFQLYPYHITKK